MVLVSSLWFLVFHAVSGWFLMVVGGSFGSLWFLLVLCGSWRLFVVLGGSRWFLLVFSGSW